MLEEESPEKLTRNKDKTEIDILANGSDRVQENKGMGEKETSGKSNNKQSWKTVNMELNMQEIANVIREHLKDWVGMHAKSGSSDFTSALQMQLHARSKIMHQYLIIMEFMMKRRVNV